MSWGWEIDCPDCGGSGGGEPPNHCLTCHGYGRITPTEDDIAYLREQEAYERGRK